METRDAIARRTSVHYFDPSRAVTDAQLRELFDAVQHAPSGYNLQPWEFVVVRDPAGKERLRTASYNQTFVADASAVIVVLSALDPARHAEAVFADWSAKGYFDEATARKTLDLVRGWSKWPREEQRVWTVRSTALAAMTLMLAAEDMGLATCPMEGFKPSAVAAAVGVPPEFEIVMLVALGYPASPPPPKAGLPRKRRRGFGEIVHLETFGRRPA
jgi:nitroreductase